MSHNNVVKFVDRLYERGQDINFNYLLDASIKRQSNSWPNVLLLYRTRNYSSLINNQREGTITRSVDPAHVS
jgi:hypothetical protein